MKNYLQIDVGGQKRGLKFNMGTYEAILELTGKDPLAYVPESNSYADLRPYAKNIFHAALLSNCRSQKVAPDFAQEDVDAWFDELSIQDVTLIINLHTGKVDSPSANGEAGKDTQLTVVG